MHVSSLPNVARIKKQKCALGNISTDYSKSIEHPSAISAPSFRIKGLTENHAERGVTLVELLVGLAIGLVVIGVAMGALMVSRGVTGTVSDASSMHQQAAYAMRVIGTQLRQAGSLRLNLEPGTTAIESRYLSPVAFEAITPASGTAKGFTPQTDTISGTETPPSITTGYRRYAEPVFTSASAQTLVRNCVGGPSDTNLDERVENVFSLSGSQLMCSGNGAAAQPVVQNVANFIVRYRLQDNAAIGLPKIRLVSAADVTNWAQVQAVEVCIELYGTERISMPAGSTYKNCGGVAVDMTTLPSDRASRSHITYRNVFQLRSQGLIGSVL
uniref:prepilin-type N-terminal cleavage/methylation domain-containing protein n=1 Tax=uncultured Acidovorax sp. TaxID=158751 RepID=UPI0030F7DDA8